MDLISDMKLFATIVAQGSMAGAARELGLAPASVTARVQGLEQRFGTTLLIRSTRSLSLTSEGETFHAACQRIVAQVEDLTATIGSDGNLSGSLRVTAPCDLGRRHVQSVTEAFLAEHPQVRVELILSDEPLALVAEGVDVAIRYGVLDDSDLIARELAANRRVVCGAPAYLERHGVPRRPADLSDHDCLVDLRDHHPLNRWSFVVDGAAMTVRVRGSRASNDGELLHEWAVAGLGLVCKSIWDVADDVAAGRLRTVLDEFSAGATPLSLVYPSSRRSSRRVKAFVDYAVAYFDQAESEVSSVAAETTRPSTTGDG